MGAGAVARGVMVLEFELVVLELVHDVGAEGLGGGKATWDR